MKPKEKYRALCEKEQAIQIFSRDWWLDATAGIDNWDVVKDIYSKVLCPFIMRL